MKQQLTPRQVALAIGVSEASLKRWCDKGLLPTIRTAGGHRRLPISGVMQFLRETGRQPVRPEVLGMPSAIGGGDITLDRGVLLVRDALEAGDEQRLRRIVLNLYLGGHGMCDICDRTLAAAFHLLGDRWQHGDIEIYQERRGCEIGMRMLYELRSALPPPPADAPYAFGATLSGDAYTLPITMVELCLLEAGWLAESFGNGHPADTLCAAIRERRPRLFWLSVSYVESTSSFLEAYSRIRAAAEETGTAVAVGGRVLTEDVRRQMDYSAYCDTIRHLITFVQALGD